MALRGTPLSQFSVDERMRWALKRKTKKKEDQAYCLLGIFDVSIPLIYGERDKARVRLLEEIEKSLKRQSIETIDTWIRQKCYSATNLRIERLSGHDLEMDQCYINLAIVQHHQDAPSSGDENAFSGDNQTAHQSSPFSLLTRLHVKERYEGTHIPLPAIFDPRRGRHGDKDLPRRILIRGQAGVGKTPLCKKIVFDFISAGMWDEPVLPYPLDTSAEVKSDVFFSTHEYPESAALELHKAINDPKSTHTLFILDGLDEVSQDFAKDSDIFQLLLYLLNRPNVVITSRPYATLPRGLDSFDLELETIGFYPEQVTTYLRKSLSDPSKVEKIQSFLSDHWLVQGLVRIPIQLDALCLTWDDGDSFVEAPETMTCLYQAIELKLWRKDIVRLCERHPDRSPPHSTDLQDMGRRGIEMFVEDEIMLLETLAFTGLHNDIMDFNADLVETICESSECLKQIFVPKKILQNVSFLRTSEPSSTNKRKYYHFLHLTFQEYFAARYFVRHWKNQHQLECLHFERSRLIKGRTEKLSPAGFLQEHKYSIRYNILWRFVTGLLQDEEAHVMHFFEVVQDPLDLLGPGHQRLIMHCLSEVTRSNSPSNFTSVRQDLEMTLSDWLRFECNFHGQAELAREIEFPEKVVCSMLRNESEGVRVAILGSLARRPRIQLSIIMVVISFLEQSQPASIIKAALMVLERQSSLSSDSVEKVAARLDHKNRYVRRAALTVLQGQSSLSSESVERVAARLEYEDRHVQQAAIRVLRCQFSLSSESVEKVAARLDHKDWHVRWAALTVLQGQSSLSSESVERVAAQLGHKN
ncbi:uncharacterized protein PV07_12642, partial [Cladophialophora immunda]